MDAESRGWLAAERSDAPVNWGFAAGATLVALHVFEMRRLNFKA
jgi:hypothetical protein